MQAVIMAGGYGTRLKPLTDNIPKPMVPIINKPLIRYIIEHLKSHGINNIILTLGYLPKCIIEYLGDGRELGVNLRYMIEREPLGTAGGVKNVEKYIEDKFLVISGDAFTNIDISSMLDFHEKNKKSITIAVKEVDDPRSFGVVKVDRNNTITSFIEKPLVIEDKLVNTGIYILEKNVLDRVPKNQKYDFGRDLFPTMLGEMSAYKMDNYWSDIGTLSSYYLTNNYVALNLDNFKSVLSK